MQCTAAGVPRRRSENRFGQSRPAAAPRAEFCSRHNHLRLCTYTGIRTRGGGGRTDSDPNPKSIVFFRAFFTISFSFPRSRRRNVYAKFDVSATAERNGSEGARSAQLTKWKTTNSPQCDIYLSPSRARPGMEMPGVSRVVSIQRSRVRIKTA